MGEEKEAIKLIDRLYRDLYLSEPVLHHSSGNKYDKFNNIKEYLEKLEEIHTKIGETERHKEFLKQSYYAKYVIKAEGIPESYYQHQKEIALERGYGHIEMDKKQLQQEVIENQKRSLDTWLDYFLSEDAKVYPFWAKYWAFQGMLKIGSYDKETKEFKGRSKNTISPFCDLNREALAMSIDMVTRMLEKQIIEEKELEVLVKTGSFSKIYSYILNKVLNNNQNIIKRNTGKWVKYNQGSNHMPLVNSLQGYNTGWCTAGESTAKSQLEGGDFYVYYTLDEQEEYKVPRIAIRMEGNKIGEIRGVAKNQNIESEMEEVVEEKLKEFPDKEEYYKKVADMKELTKIYKKHQQQEELTKEDLTFLYEINGKIKGFGYGIDPRIEEIKTTRGRKKEDLALVLNCDKSQIALQKDEIDEDTIYYDGDLSLQCFTGAGDLIMPKYIKGYLNLRSLTSAKGLILPQNVSGSLYLSDLTSAEGLVLPQNVGGPLYLNNLISAKDLVLPQSIGGNIYLNNLMSVENLVLPQNISGTLDLRSLTSVKDLVLPQIIGGSLNLSGLKSTEGLVLPQIVGGIFILSSLTSTEGLIIPEPLTYTIFMDRCIITPENVEQYRNSKNLSNNSL